MKSMLLFSACLFVFISAISGATVTFDPSQTGSKIVPGQMAGTCLPVWNSADIYNEIKKGLATSNYRLFRFPNGSTSDGYHWNGSGAYSADGIWTCDTANYLPGFVGMTKYRGTSVNNYGFSGSSNITDGDSSTYWQSDEGDTENPPYCYLEFSMTGIVDSIVILWGDDYAVDFDVDFYGVWGSFSPGPFKMADDQWINIKKVTGNTGKTSAFWLDSTTVTRYLRVITRKLAPSRNSVQIKDIYCFSKGKQITVNAKRYDGTSGSQTRVIAEPTFAGNVVRPDAASWKTWHFESYMAYIKSIDSAAIPLICVNYGTGTPEEAAAWVYYANIVKKYGIKFWQVGNEMDGEWEEGGPVSARMYAEKFLRFSRAMKQVDPTIKVLGPVMSNADFNQKNSGSADGKSWMQGFMEYIGAKEKADNVKYCDGIDFHSYPFWSSAPTAPAMMAKIDYTTDQSDSLVTWIKNNLVAPDSVYVMMSEFNSSVVLSDLLQKRVNGVFLANMFAGHVDKFGSRAMSVVWDSYEALCVGPLMTYGALSLFDALPGSQYSSMTLAPSSAYWGLYTLQNIWIDPTQDNFVVKAAYSRSDSVRAYGMKTANDFRALLINISSDSLPVNCTLSGGNYSQVDVYTWSQAEFGWIGYDQNAFAYPNCGPSSHRMAPADLKNLKIPPLSLCVARFSMPDSNDRAPVIVHLGSRYRLCTDTQRLALYVTASGGINPIMSIDYAVDSNNNYTPLRPVDGGFDGPYENAADSISVTSIPYGNHRLYVRARTKSSVAAIDTFTFVVQGKLYPVTLIDNFQDSDFVPVLPGSTPWKAGANIANGTTITPAIKNRNNGDYYYNGDFTVMQPAALNYTNFVQINSYADSNYIKLNAGRFKGITFTYSAVHSSSAGAFFVHILSRKVLDDKDYDEFNVQLSPTGGLWRTVTYSWGDFHQYPWGVQVGALDAADVRGFEFRLQGAGQGSFAFDNIAFLGDSGSAINLRVKLAQTLVAGMLIKEYHTLSAVDFVISGGIFTAPLKALVYSIDGKEIREIAGMAKGDASVISWKYDRKDKSPVAGGIYLVIIKAGRTAVSRNRVVVE
jgi:hypothetical protein